MVDSANNTAPSGSPDRPLSPHLTIYRWKLHMALSILHRATGAALALSAPLLVYWLWTAAYAPDYFAPLQHFFKTPLGLLMLLGWSFAFYLHLMNGIRHLFWDIGKGFEIHTAWKTGMLAVLTALIATAGTWIYVCKHGGPL